MNQKRPNDYFAILSPIPSKIVRIFTLKTIKVPYYLYQHFFKKARSLSFFKKMAHSAEKEYMPKS